MGTCICGTLYYYDSALSSTACSSRKSKSTVATPVTCSSSSECLEVYGLTCSGGTCVCKSSLQFWNTTALECQYLIAVNGLCDTTYVTTICADAFATCTSYNLDNSVTPAVTVAERCICNAGYIFNPTTSACTAQAQQNAVCSKTSDCITYAYCGLITGQTSTKCWCDSLYAFYNSACVTRKTQGGACVTGATTLNEQCNTNYYNLACQSTSLCDCDTTYQYAFDTDFCKLFIK